MKQQKNLFGHYSKKGNLLVIGLIFLLVVGLLFFITVLGTQHYLVKEVNTMVQDSDFSTEATTTMQEFTNKNNTAWDNAFLLFTIGLLIGLFLAGATLNNNPVILILVIIILIVTAYIGMHIVNLYEDLVDSNVTTIDFQTNFPKAHLIMSNLVIVLITGSLLLGLGMFTGERIGL